MAEEPRPYSERPAARPDPERVKALADAEAKSEAAAGQGKGSPWELKGCGFGCVMIFAIGAVLYVIFTLIGLLIPD